MFITFTTMDARIMPVILMILGFVWWWPLGLLMLGFLIARGRFGYWRHLSYAGDGPMLNWEHRGDRWERKIARMQDRMEHMRGRMERFRSRSEWFAPSSGNSAFDDYRSETLKRLEDEQREFKEFLARLRFAKDRNEFDQFMAERRERPLEPNSPAEPPAGPHN